MDGGRRAGEGDVQIGLLGPLEAVRGGRALGLGGQKPRSLLAALALDVGRVVSVDRLRAPEGRTLELHVTAPDWDVIHSWWIPALGGKIDADKAMAVAKGWKTQSPRGPISIDPQTRDIVQTIYVRRVEKKGNELWNVEFDKFENVPDPGKQ